MTQRFAWYKGWTERGFPDGIIDEHEKEEKRRQRALEAVYPELVRLRQAVSTAITREERRAAQRQVNAYLARQKAGRPGRNRQEALAQQQATLARLRSGGGG